MRFLSVQTVAAAVALIALAGCGEKCTTSTTTPSASVQPGTEVDLDRVAHAFLRFAR